MIKKKKVKLICCIVNSLLRLFTFIFFLAISQPLNAQTDPNDTIRIIEKIVEKHDTMIRNVVPENVPQKRSLLQGDTTTDSILYNQNGNRFRRELYNFLYRNGDDALSDRKSPTTNSILAAMDGKIIRHIEFVNVDIFSPTVSDTTYVPSSWIEKTINVSHRDTRRNVVDRYLLLKKGEPLDVFLAAENERILRDLPFIMDARFVARPVTGSPDSVDILLLTQDLIPYGFEVEMVKSSLVTVGLSNQNFLGFGHQFRATSFWDSDNIPHFGYNLSYGTANIAGTFVAGKMLYIHRWNQESYLVDISRDFRATSFKNAGGLMLDITSIHKNIELLDTTLYDIDLNYTNTDVWYGRMFHLNKNSSGVSSGIFLNGRWNQYSNNDAPTMDDVYSFNYQDKTLLLFSTGFTRQRFRKDNLIYTFGRTEDVPTGFLFDITAGVETREHISRNYFSAGGAFGNYFRNAGYFFGQLKFGTFVDNGHMEQGTFRAQLRYFSPLHQKNRFRQRNFVNITYIRGINRINGEFTSLENRGGIAGLTSQSMRGHEKVHLNLESVVFSPFIFMGFKFAFFGSLDLGLVKLENEKLSNSRIFSGISAGVRIRNDQLVFDTFVIKFAVYPGKPDDGVAQYLDVDNTPRLKLNDYFPYKPATVNFQ